MKIFVKFLSNYYQDLIFDCNLDLLIIDLKYKIEQKTSIPIINQRLVYSGKTLSNDEKLSVYNIKNLNTIYLYSKT